VLIVSINMSLAARVLRATTSNQASKRRKYVSRIADEIAKYMLVFCGLNCVGVQRVTWV
jgi:hypothetical protein